MATCMITLFCLFVQILTILANKAVFDENSTLPVVFWHGMGDSCFNPISMGSFVKMVEEERPGIHTNCLKFGSGITADTLDGFFMNTNDQITEACEMIKKDALLAKGYNAIGLSQGGQFLRAVAQRCPDPPMHNLISLGGQHQGVFGFPRCPQASLTWVCDKAREMLTAGAYTDYVQDHLVQAQYWHDPTEPEEYVAKSKFIAEINQLQGIKAEYKTNLMKLRNFVMVKFNNDSMVIPRESEWFGYYIPGQDKEMQTLRQSTIYINDTLGLKEMDKAGKLHFLGVDGDHLQFSQEWFKENILNKFL